MRLRQDLAPRRHGGLVLRHPVLVAAGGAGYGNELLEAVGDDLPGAIVTRSVTRDARRGARPPRMVPRPDGLLHAVGTPNPGLEAVLRRQGPRWGATDVPVIVSLWADNADDIAVLARTLETHPDAAGLESWLKQQLDPSFTLRLVKVKGIPALPSGKFEEFVSELPVGQRS